MERLCQGNPGVMILRLPPSGKSGRLSSPNALLGKSGSLGTVWSVLAPGWDASQGPAVSVAARWGAATTGLGCSGGLHVASPPDHQTGKKTPSGKSGSPPPSGKSGRAQRRLCQGNPGVMVLTLPPSGKSGSAQILLLELYRLTYYQIVGFPAYRMNVRSCWTIMGLSH